MTCVEQAMAAQQLYELRLSELLAAGGGLPLPPGLTPAEAAGFGLFGAGPGTGGGAPGFDAGFPLAHSALISHYANSLAAGAGATLSGALLGAGGGVGMGGSSPTMPPPTPTTPSPARDATPTNKHGEKDKVSAHFSLTQSSLWPLLFHIKSGGSESCGSSSYLCEGRTWL